MDKVDPRFAQAVESLIKAKTERAPTPPPGKKLPELATAILHAITAVKATGMKSIKVGEIGDIIERVLGPAKDKGKFYPVITRVCEDHFLLKMIGITSGRRYEMPPVLPVIKDGVLVSPASYKWPEPATPPAPPVLTKEQELAELIAEIDAIPLEIEGPNGPTKATFRSETV